MSWFIQEDVNNGYPALNTWREKWQTSWTSDSSHRYPDYMWRIQSGVNKGYPWIYPWFKETTTDTGDIIIGGSQTNYPNGLSGYGGGGIEDDFDDNSQISVEGGAITNRVIMNALADRAFAINGNTVQGILENLNEGTIIDTDAINLISKIYGANVYDCFLICKAFPFDLTRLSYGSSISPYSVVSADKGYIKAFGRYQLSEIQFNLLASSFGYYMFPTIHVNPTYAWQIENIDFSIYLPMSGIYPIDILGECDVDILLYCDLLTGTGEYNIYINGQQYATYRVLLGVDVPLNTNEGRMQGNMLSNVISSFGTVAGTVIGGAVGGVGGAMIGGTIGQMTSFLSPHYSMSNPAIGGLASIQCNGYPRILAKIPKRFRDCYGYQEILGVNRSTGYSRLNECSGYVKCRNYKTDIIVATDSEKLEIEQLMNNGVFI